MIRASGQGYDRSENARRYVHGALHHADIPLLWSEKVDGAGDTIAAWVGTGPARAAGNEILTPIFHSAEWAPDETEFLAQVHQAVENDGWIDLHLGSLLRRAFLPSGVALPVFPGLVAGAAPSVINVRISRLST